MADTIWTPATHNAHSGACVCQDTESGEERKRIATQFNAARGADYTQEELRAEMTRMMSAACDPDALGADELFATTCAKVRTEL